MIFDKAQTNTILAALRYYQQKGFGNPELRPDWVQEIACPTPDDTSLDTAGIDELCEAINAPETVPYGVSPKTEAYIVMPSGMVLVFESPELSPKGTDYVRILDPLGGELYYWDSAEWEEDPELVMGVICHSLMSLEMVDDPERIYQFGPDVKFPEGVEFLPYEAPDEVTIENFCNDTKIGLIVQVQSINGHDKVSDFCRGLWRTSDDDFHSTPEKIADDLKIPVEEAINLAFKAYEADLIEIPD